MTSLMLLPWQQFCHWCNSFCHSFCLNQEPSTAHNLLMGVTTTWELCLFQVGPFVSLWRLLMGIFGFWTESDWNQKSYYGNNTKGVICFFCDGHLWCQVSRILLKYFQRYHLFRFYHFSVAVVWHHHWSDLHNRKMPISLKEKRRFKKKNAILLYFKKPFR